MDDILKRNHSAVYFYMKDHQGNNRIVLDKNDSIMQVNHYYPFGALFGESKNGGLQKYKYNGKELERMYELDLYDYGARWMDPVLDRFTTPDPLCEKYYSISPYAYCGNNPIKYIDPTGEAWRATYDEDHDGERTPNGYEWVDDADSYDKNGNLMSGLYAQAIFFSDNETFNAASKKNMGSSTATVYLADGTTVTFDATTYPSGEDYPTVPEGTYHAKVGKHKGEYTALRMSDTDNSGRIELGSPNPAHPTRTYAEGINIHYPGKNNLTGKTNTGSPVSAGCLLIDRNRWDEFISIFDTPQQRHNTVGVTVSRSMIAPVNANRLPAFNFIMNGTRRSFFNH